MATVTVTETEVRITVNVYRNMNGVGPGGTKVTISAWSVTDHPEVVEGRRSMDEDVTALLSPAQLAQFDAILDVGEQYIKNKWNIPT